MCLKADIPSKMKSKYIYFLEHIASGIIMYLKAEFPSKMKGKKLFFLEIYLWNYKVFKGRCHMQK